MRLLSSTISHGMNLCNFFIILCHSTLSFHIRAPLFASRHVLFTSNNIDDVPSMDWLTDSLSTATTDNDEKDITENLYIEEHDPDGVLGEANNPIPSTGISVADEMEKTQKERFCTDLVAIKGLEEGVRAAQIVTTTTAGSFEPVRYVIGLSKEETKAESKESPSQEAPKETDQSFVMVDVPKYSDQLAKEIREFMGVNGQLAAILITSKDCIHYDEAPGIFSMRRADLLKWEKAFPDTSIFGYRMDIPRDCRESITKQFDGYGPFMLEESSTTNVTFVESGRPLTYEEWDYDVTQDVFAGKVTPPDDDFNATSTNNVEDEIDDPYSPEAIRLKEEGKRVLAVYTPGRTYGSMSYVFPEINLVASGYTIPVEDTRNEENVGIESTGPVLDVRGYITTGKAGLVRQMESARNLIETYADRFTVILPSLCDPYYLDDVDAKKRKQELLKIVDQYQKIGEIYERLGISSYDDDDEEDI